MRREDASWHLVSPVVTPLSSVHQSNYNMVFRSSIRIGDACNPSITEACQTEGCSVSPRVSVTTLR